MKFVKFPRIVYSYLISSRFMAMLLLALAISMAIGTFLDAGQEKSPTAYSRAMVYNTFWFEAILVLLMVNFIGNIKNHNLIKNKKWTILILHLSFVFIILGAGITRYIGYEGVIPIYEGETNDKMLSDDTYISVWMDGDMNGETLRKKDYKKLYLSERLDNEFEMQTNFNEKSVKIKALGFTESAEEQTEFIQDVDGVICLHFVESSEGQRKDHYIKAGQLISIGNQIVSFQNDNLRAGINIYIENDSLKIRSAFKGNVFEMSSNKETEIAKYDVVPVKLLSLYSINGLSFVIPENPKVGITKKVIKKTKNSFQDALQVQVEINDEKETVTLFGAKGVANTPKKLSLGGLDVHLSYGSKEIELPFSVRLNKLLAEKYPGADPNTYGVGFKSYESQVTIMDTDVPDFDARIFMNNILDFKGYRFFQSSIDFSSANKKIENTPDITVLSVNHDFWGTTITYLGYYMLYLGLMLVMFDKKTRFKYLEKIINKQKGKKILTSLLFFFICFNSVGQESSSNNQHLPLDKITVDSILFSRAIPKGEAEKFGQLLLQDVGGRMKPVNSYASELLRKVSGKDHYEDLDPNQVLLSMTQNPRLWFDVPLIKLKRGNDSIRSILSLNKNAKYASLSNFFTFNGEPKISQNLLQDAFSVNAPNQFQKDIRKAYEAQRLIAQALNGSLIKIFPIPNEANNKWESVNGIKDVDFGPDSKVIKSLFPYGYFDAIHKKDYDLAEKILESIAKLQTSYGKEIVPSKNKIELEVKYNRWNIFKRVYYGYLLFGFFLFTMVILRIFSSSKLLKYAVVSLKLGVYITFMFHIVGLALRWYISGHAPWSDAYESMIYVAFATIIFGILFGRKSDLTLAASTFVSAMILMIAHWNWMDPSISNLEPVLDSYWLMVHVAVIVASYGPFTISAIMGGVTLLLMLLTTSKNKQKMKVFIKETQAITEMAITIGLIMLTIGNFLGGQWANESWGRYWGWDPKETWALITIIIYAFVLHMRLVPGLRSKWLFSFVTILAFGSVLMTYFGVNFWLVGLHSYASGDQIFSVKIILITLVIISLFGMLSYSIGYKKHFK